MPDIMFVDATPLCLGLVYKDCYISLPLQDELPIYHAEFLAILYACFYAISTGVSQLHVVSDNQAAIFTCRSLRGYTLPLSYMIALYQVKLLFKRFTLSY